MKILVPNKRVDDGLVIQLQDGNAIKDIGSEMLELASHLLFNAPDIFPTYDSTLNYEVGTTVYDTTSTTNYKALRAKNDNQDFWIEYDPFGFFVEGAYSRLKQSATLFESTKYYKEQTYVFTETANDTDNDGVIDNYTYKIYMTVSDGVSAISDMQYLYEFTSEYKITGDIHEKLNAKIAVTHGVTYNPTLTIKKGFIYQVVIYAEEDGGHTTSVSPIVPFRALVDAPTSTPLEGNVLEWEQLPFYGELALFDKYLNTKFILPAYTGFELTFNNSQIDAIAVLGVQGDNAKVKWTNNYTEVQEDFKLKDRVVSDFYEYFFSDFNQTDMVYSTKQITNIDYVNIQIDGYKVGASSIIVGKEYFIGNALYGYEKISRDFSKKTTTASGYDYLTAGKKANTYRVKIVLDNNKANEVFDLLQSLSTTLVLYVLGDGSWVYGWYKDLYMTKSNPVKSEYELEINGVI